MLQGRPVLVQEGQLLLEKLLELLLLILGQASVASALVLDYKVVGQEVRVFEAGQSALQIFPSNVMKLTVGLVAHASQVEDADIEVTENFEVD